MTTLLVVEDSFMLRQTLHELLTKRFPALYVAGVRDGEEALGIVDGLQPDIVLLDLMLPERIGLCITGKLRARLPKAAIVAFVDFDAPAYRKAAFSAGASHVLWKRSCSATRILDLIDTLISPGIGVKG
jgi:DNA-binding NarL/FixJ family response regulator